MVLIKLGKQQMGAGGEWVEMQIAIPVQVLGLVCERKLHKQSFEGLGLGAVYCCSVFPIATALPAFPSPCIPLSVLLPELVWLCQEPSPGKPHSAMPRIFVNVKYQ